VEMAELIRRHGGEPMVVPSMRELPVGENVAALDYLRRLDAGEIDVVILMTGIGLRLLIEAVAAQWPRDRLAAALRRARLVARGPKPVAVLRELGLHPDVIAPEPNTWRELLAALDATLPMAGKRVAIQEYGVSNAPFIAALEARGATVECITIYRWALPEDLAPLRAAIDALVSNSVNIALFTSATQVDHLFRVAADRSDQLRLGLTRTLIASIGPVCTEALEGHGVTADLIPIHPKMGQLVGDVARRGRTLLATKRRLNVSA